eukprot:CAMPEP_0202692280 /NCGR_PEP_ID=MMETSP1385-20130828/6693_1 /ASSEMBLY_ACC=CAM_ASM_000861 /TAXON_ID=933848 /ORGANISM="Elphidium margaritaceum" /LENGTH=1814 /DNA_ID=CAMNT_0049347777 /DNA_START=122 /DNA_END=5566 /DNA_ORIENTATION=+
MAEKELATELVSNLTDQKEPTDNNETKDEQDTSNDATKNATDTGTVGTSGEDKEEIVASSKPPLANSKAAAPPEPELSGIAKWRRAVRLDVVQTAWFETVILVVIVINCVFLALDNPKNEDETLEIVIFVTEVVFTIIYCLEIAIKWFAYGLFGRHVAATTSADVNNEQKASVFQYMVHSVFQHGGNDEKRDNYVGYFLDGWNVLDFLVVVIGSIVPLILGPGAASVASIRAIRILRALRTIPRVPRLKSLVATIINALPGLTGTAVLLSFFFIVFGIIGIQLFHGDLKQQCTTDVLIDGEEVRVPLTYISLSSEYVAFCSNDDGKNPSGDVLFPHAGMYTCNDLAVALGENIVDAPYECTGGNENPLAGMQNYDNIFYALLQVFQAVTLQDWSAQMYNIARGNTYMVAFFFIPLTFLVSFFAINLILAVIVNTYGESIFAVQTEEDTDDTLDEMDELIQQKTSKRSAPVKQQITYQTYPRKLRALRDKVKTFEQLFKEYNQGPVERANKQHELQRKTKMRVDTTRGNDAEANVKSLHLELQAIAEDIQNESKEEMYDTAELKEETWEFTERADRQRKLRKEMIEDMMLNFNKDLAFEVWLLAKPIKDDWLNGKAVETPIAGRPVVDRRHFWEKKKGTPVRWLHWCATSEWFERLVIFTILLNTIALAIQWPAMDESLFEALRILNYLFTALFALELLVKFIGLGPQRWWFDMFNIFDAVIVLISVVELFLPNSQGAAVSAFRALRVLRVLRLLHQIPGLRSLFTSILASFEPVVFLILIILIFVFMFGVLGVQIYSGEVYPDLRLDDDGQLSGFLQMTRPWRFGNLWYSMIAFLQLFTADGWPLIMEDTVTARSSASVLLVVIAVVIGLWLFRNMFLAILINRMSTQDNIQVMIDDLLDLAKQKQRILEQKGAIKDFERDVRTIRRQRLGSQVASKHQQRIEEIEASKRITGKSFKRFAPDNRMRMWVHKLQASDAFEWCINSLILVNCVFLAINGPHVPLNSELGVILRVLDIFFTVTFTIEMLLKMFALGVYVSPFTVSICGKTFGGSSGGDGALDATADADEKMSDKEKKLAFDSSSNLGLPQVDKVEVDPATMPCTNAYFHTWWNRLDALVVFFAIIGLFAPQVKFLRGLRAIRPIRIAIRIPQVRVVVKSLGASLGNVFHAVCFSFFILFVLGIVGVQLFCGQFGRCIEVDSASPFDVVYPPQISEATEAACVAEGYEYIVPGYNFDNIVTSTLTVFKISMFSNWYEELASGMAATGNARHEPSAGTAVPYNQPFAALFFVGIVLVAGFFVLNIIISVVVDSFNRIKNEDEANALLTPEQVLWVRKRRFLQHFPLKMGHKPPRQAWRMLFFNFIEQPCFEYFIIGCILVNTIILMCEHDGQPQSLTDAMLYLEYVFLAIYTIEAALKLTGYGVRQYFRDWWNVFDFLIVFVSLATIGFNSGFAVIRLLRVLRVIRLVKRAPLLRALFITLGYAVPSIVNIGLLCLVIFFIFGIFGVELFGTVVPSDGYGNPILYDGNDGLTPSVNFEYFNGALLILYRSVTNDGWGSILFAAGAQGSNCPDSLRDFYTNRGLPADGAFEYQCGSMPWAVIYFVLFSIFGTFVLINLFIAVILDTYVDNVEFEKKLLDLELMHEWKANWREKEKTRFGTKRKPFLPIKDFITTLKESPLLVGKLLHALNLRLNIEDTDVEIDYANMDELKRRSTDAYGKLDFVGRPNPLDAEVKVTNDHLNAIFTTRRLRILCTYRGSQMDEQLVVMYSDALFAMASLLVGPEFRLLPYDSNQVVHLADWWAEQLEEMMMSGSPRMFQQ